MGLGIGAAIAGAGAWVGGGLAAATGLDAAAAGLIGSGVVDAGIGAGLGAGEAAITGGDPATGALTGGLTGGAVGGFGGLAGDALGIGAVGGDALVGTAAGALGSAITGGNPLTGAVVGGVGGAATGLLGGGGSADSAPAAATAAPGASALSIAPPPGVSGVTDLTAGLDTGAITDPTLGGLAGGGGTSGVGSLAGGGTGGTGGGIGSLTSGGGTGPSGITALSASPLSAQPIDTGTIPTVNGATSGASGIAPSAGGGGGESSIDKAWNNPTTGNILGALGANAGPLVAGGGLLMDLAGGQTAPGQNQIGQLAGGLQTEGQQLSSYLKNGTLPPGAQAGIDQATKAAQAATRSKYASAGMSGSSAETQDLNNITEQAQAQTFQEANSLLQDGLNATSTSGQLYADLMNFDSQESAQTGQAIASLAGALDGGGTVIKLGG